MNLKRRLAALENVVSAIPVVSDDRTRQALTVMLQQKAARYYAAPDLFSLDHASLMEVCAPHCFDPDGTYNPVGEQVLRALLTIDPHDPRQRDQFKRQYAPQ